MKSVLALILFVPALAHADSVRVATIVVDGPPGSVGNDVEVPSNEPSLVVQVPVENLSAIAEQSAVVGSERGVITGTALTVPQGRVEVGARTAILVSGLTIN